MFRLARLFDLSERTALVTGGNSGIGHEIARALGLAGASLVLVARREPELVAAVDKLHTDGINADFVAGDLSTTEGLSAIIAGLKGQRRIDILVNAAGMNFSQPFEEVTAEAFDLHLAVHLRAPFLLTQALAPAMAERGWGRVLNVAALQSFRAFPDSTAYSVAKGGIVQLTRAIAEAWSGRGITCNAIAPGFFPTPLTQAIFDDEERVARKAVQTAIGRTGRLEDLHGAAVFLASEASAYVTGQTIAVDGGFTAK
ncbi:SDR family NAD(P)-dependent oxidoreductase [Enterovirga rhinocerotis]|uniref:Gluconate 5-dehydrogenase n=1 Tax=Enterovirga rhinocerotis TaxID=1339210 RepID=A0A4R7BV05_9HYPH|nr:SDR family oxidoreductase [Enterovirga rhinocerotis]TDR88027.1 gluconate 5-dehydrogenase [Enterovirga rhinocerotis]